MLPQYVPVVPTETAVGTVLTVPVHASRIALSQPAAFTLAAYNVVVALMLGENGLAVLVNVPPAAAVYHATVQEAAGVTLNATVPVPQLE